MRLAQQIIESKEGWCRILQYVRNVKFADFPEYPSSKVGVS